MHVATTFCNYCDIFGAIYSTKIIVENAHDFCARGLEFKSQATKSYIALQTIRSRFIIYANVVVLPWLYDKKMYLANSSHASVS